MWETITTISGNIGNEVEGNSIERNLLPNNAKISLIWNECAFDNMFMGTTSLKIRRTENFAGGEGCMCVCTKWNRKKTLYAQPKNGYKKPLVMYLELWLKKLFEYGRLENSKNGFLSKKKKINGMRLKRKKMTFDKRRYAYTRKTVAVVLPLSEQKICLSGNTKFSLL